MFMTLKKSAPHEYHTKQRWISGESREVSEPDNLSDRDKEYYDNYCKNFTMSDVETLCKILVHPNEEIFTESNIQEFNY